MQVRRTRGIRPLTRCSLAQGSLAQGSLAQGSLAQGSLARGSLTRGSLRIALGAMLAAAAIAGCSASATPKAAASAQACGAGRTAANVAIEVEKDYAAAIVAGQAPGNGGGGPVTVSGWKCQGFATPELLKTGDVSKCGKDGMQ